MTGAAVGREVGLYFDTPREVAEGDVIVNAYVTGQPERRAYLVVGVRRQQRGRHVGRWHLRAVVLSSTPEQLAAALADLDAEQTVHRMYWYPRAGR
ncbi:MAG: hypothetical protein AB7R77_26285 [Ilumatobacteraceae bacterium]